MEFHSAKTNSFILLHQAFHSSCRIHCRKLKSHLDCQDFAVRVNPFLLLRSVNFHYSSFSYRKESKILWSEWEKRSISCILCGKYQPLRLSLTGRHIMCSWLQHLLMWRAPHTSSWSWVIEWKQSTPNYLPLCVRKYTCSATRIIVHGTKR